MAFGVALQVPGNQAQTTVVRLQNPVWDLYLGRKCCAPTELIYQGLFSTAAEALGAGDRLAKEKGKVFAFRVLQGEHGGEVVTLNDVPVQFGEEKRYRDRRVTVQNWLE
jgi:CRISPR system Cascade subunit CasD